MIDIYLHNSPQDQGIIDAIEGNPTSGEYKVGECETFSEGLRYLQENHPEKFVVNQWALKRRLVDAAKN